MSTDCSICGYVITLNSDTEEAEIVHCPDCQSALVVESISAAQDSEVREVVLAEAPAVEEDWGE
jgi:hypothetical protein